MGSWISVNKVIPKVELASAHKKPDDYTVSILHITTINEACKNPSKTALPH